ncbi:MAG TPA: hypothetical protein V6D28_02300 [Leptolyngbyaceae cyanobacterium]
MNQDQINALGASLRPIDQSLLKPGKDNSVKRIWYQGEESYFDIFFELKHNEIVWFQFTLRGKTLSWDKRSAQFQTGTTNELKPDEVTFYPASKLILSDRKIDIEFIEIVRAILETRAGEPLFDRALQLFECQPK